jgi:hypothetical protein
MLWKLGDFWRVRAEQGVEVVPGEQAKGREGGDERMGAMMAAGGEQEGRGVDNGVQPGMARLSVDYR